MTFFEFEELNKAVDNLIYFPKNHHSSNFLLTVKEPLTFEPFRNHLYHCLTHNYNSVEELESFQKSILIEFNSNFNQYLNSFHSSKIALKDLSQVVKDFMSTLIAPDREFNEKFENEFQKNTAEIDRSSQIITKLQSLFNGRNHQRFSEEITAYSNHITNKIEFKSNRYHLEELDGMIVWSTLFYLLRKGDFNEIKMMFSEFEDHQSYLIHLMKLTFGLSPVSRNNIDLKQLRDNVDRIRKEYEWMLENDPKDPFKLMIWFIFSSISRSDLELPRSVQVLLLETAEDYVFLLNIILYVRSQISLHLPETTVTNEYKDFLVRNIKSLFNGSESKRKTSGVIQRLRFYVLISDLNGFGDFLCLLSQIGNEDLMVNLALLCEVNDKIRRIRIDVFKREIFCKTLRKKAREWLEEGRQTDSVFCLLTLFKTHIIEWNEREFESLAIDFTVSVLSSGTKPNETSNFFLEEMNETILEKAADRLTELGQLNKALKLYAISKDYESMMAICLRRCIERFSDQKCRTKNIKNAEKILQSLSKNDLAAISHETLQIAVMIKRFVSFFDRLDHFEHDTNPNRLMDLFNEVGEMVKVIQSNSLGIRFQFIRQRLTNQLIPLFVLNGMKIAFDFAREESFVKEIPKNGFDLQTVKQIALELNNLSHSKKYKIDTKTVTEVEKVYQEILLL